MRIATYQRAMLDALMLAEIREQRGITQQDLAGKLGVTQANITRIEHEEDLYLSTLRGYVAALGGELEIHVASEQIMMIMRPTSPSGIRTKYGYSRPGQWHGTGNMVVKCVGDRTGRVP